MSPSFHTLSVLLDIGEGLNFVTNDREVFYRHRTWKYGKEVEILKQGKGAMLIHGQILDECFMTFITSLQQACDDN